MLSRELCTEELCPTIELTLDVKEIGSCCHLKTICPQLAIPEPRVPIHLRNRESFAYPTTYLTSAMTRQVP